jgi:ABC-2 type transport system ATP-binding protein
MNVLSIRDVVKSYDSKVAVNHTSIEVPEGIIYGLLGPNGAGKTSLIRIITTITRPDSGEVYFMGEKLAEKHTSLIGYMPEERGLYKKMKVGEQLVYLARLKGLSLNDAKAAVDYWFEKFQIKDWYNKKIMDLSKGMQQKVQFVATVMHKPKLIILDEPFSGLDPINALLIEDEILNLKKQGTSIIFSTHRMEQVEEICDRIVLINNGENVLEGDVKEIKNTYKENLYKIQFQGSFNEDLAAFGEVREQIENELVIQCKSTNLANELLTRMIKNGILINSFNEILPTINDIFIRKVEGKI